MSLDSMDMTQSILTSHPFSLFAAFPWSTQLLLDIQSVGGMAKEDVLGSYGTGLQALIGKLEGFEKTILDAKSHPLRPILLASPEKLIAERLRELSALSSERLSNLACILLDYCLLDISTSLRLGSSPSGQPNRLPIPFPPKMFFKQVSNWPNLVTRGLRLLRDCGDDHAPAPFEGPFDATRSIFTSLVRRKDTIEGHKIMGNFECAAAHLSLIFKGVTDLPSTVPEFQALISKICKDNGLHADRWDAFFSSIKTVHSFKLPLLFALASSASCLFLPSSIMTKDLNRHLLLQIWQGLGGPRPEQLIKIDHILWCALFDIALGHHPMSTRFRAAFREIESLELSAVGFPDSEWLSGGTHIILSSFSQFHVDLHPFRPVLSRSSADSTFPNAEGRLFPSPTRPSKATQSSKPTGAQRHTSPEPPSPVEEIMVHRPVTRSVAAQASTNQPAIAPVYPVSSPASRKKGKKKGALTPRVVKARADSVLSTSSEEAVVARKRTLSQISEPSATLSMKALKLEDGNRLKVYETIDLTVEANGPPVIDLSVDETDEIVRFNSEPFTLRNSVGISEYTARFHSQQEAEWFTSLCRSITQFYLPLTKPFFSVFSSQRIDKLSILELQNHLSRGAIVIPGSPQIDQFKWQASAPTEFCTPTNTSADFSIPPSRNRLMAGNLKQLLQSVAQDGKALATVDFPMTGGVSPLVGLASDAYAWNMTLDQPWCHRRWEMPTGAVRAAAVTTRDAYTAFHVPGHGFAIHIEVKSGSQVLIVCQPASFNPHNFSNFTMLEQLAQPFLSDWKTLSFQAFHLPEGYTAILKPLVPFFLLSTKPSIVHTCRFIATSTLQSTCTGFLVSAALEEPSDNTAQLAAHSLLRRLVHYYHLVYLQPNYFLNKEDFPHVPNILTWEGIITLLSLCNVFELSNAILYTLSDLDRHRNVEARRLCRRMVSWLDAQLIFTGAQQNQLNVYHGVYLLYLARQTKALVAYREIVEQRTGCPNPGILRAKVESTFRDQLALHAKMSELKGWTADGFGWPSDLTFDVTVRESPGAVPDDITGEMSDDIEHFGML